ncbi:MAG: helix-turn-helix transcriptional regulator [Clostridia bacterium]|nr:helix-turn-helix transcriptional regulator [Clostridia bacterium]
MMEKCTLGQRLKNARKALNLTADDIAEECYINPIYLRHLEGDRGLPSLPLFISLCNALKVSPNYLLQDQLEHSDNDLPDEFAELWKKATPSQQQMILSMLKAALETMPEN